MELSKIAASIAVVLGAVLAMGHAGGNEGDWPPPAKETAQDRVAAREAMRRAALAEHQKRKEDFARRCAKPVMSSAELEVCRTAYRRL